MKNIFRIFFLSIIIGFFFFESAFSQSRIDTIRQKLLVLKDSLPGLNEKVEYEVTGLPLQELLQALGKAYGLNINVDPSLNTVIYNNFSNVSLYEVLLFICEHYNLDIKFYGSILSLVPYTEIPKIIVQIPREVKLNYDLSSQLVTADLLNDTLRVVFKKLSEQSGLNFSFSPQIANKLITAYVGNATLDDALLNIAQSNSLSITSIKPGFFDIELIDKPSSASADKLPGKNQQTLSSLPSGLFLKSVDGKINVVANDVAISDLIEATAKELNKKFYIFSQPKGNIDLTVEGLTFEEFLTRIFYGSDFTYKYDKGIYLIGNRSQEGLRLTEIFQFQYRTVDKVQDLIPADLKKDIDIKIFTDLNSFILSGSEPNINELKSFLLGIDKLVPVVQIEVIIVDVRKSRTVSTGIQAGIKGEPTPTQGTVFPNLDLSLSSSSINQILGIISGLGIVNLGKVAPNFYLNLQFLEDQGYLKMRSTPKLATLNGNEATLTIGRTEYYLETQNNVIGSQNPQNIITQQFKPISANLDIKIKPIVSGDDQVTLDIDMNQSSFTERISQNAPPGNITRGFKSLIRIKNEEMIVLGGLEENSTRDSSRGTPFLSRIPILKWLFSSRTRATSKSKLIIFIRPTVIY